MCAASKHGDESLRARDRTRFFVAGVPKSGTTALCQFLGQHPQVFMCPIKEPSFFAAQELMAVDVPALRSAIDRKSAAVDRWFDGAVSERPLDGLALRWSSYAALFRDVREEIAIGEGSMAYWWAPAAPRGIQARFPDARFVFILRHPADRFYSQYLATKWANPRRSCRDCFALAREGRGEWGAVLDLGRYATNLRRFFDCFPRRQFNIHLYEEFSDDPLAVCRDIFGFLGVDADYAVDVSARVNEPILPRSPNLMTLRRLLGGSSALSQVLPTRWRDTLRRLYVKPRSSEVMQSEDRLSITDFYRKEIMQTSELIGRDLSSWLV